MILLSLRGGGTSNPLETRVWGSRNLEVKKFGSLVHHLSTKVFAFTMAELLIGMTIIGILAAIILPSLNANLNEKLWKTQRKALYTILSQAITQLPAMGGYGDYDTTNGVDNSAEVFITKGLATVLKINQICAVDYDATDEDVKNALKQCGISSRFTDLRGNDKNFPLNNKQTTQNVGNSPEYINQLFNRTNHVAAFQTANGSNVAVFYNRNATDRFNYVYSYANPNVYSNIVSAIFVYDLNGLTGPNRIGQDMGVFVAVKSSDPELISIDPVLEQKYVNRVNAGKHCVQRDKTSHMVSMNEFFAILATQNFYGGTFQAQTGYWTSTPWEENPTLTVTMGMNAAGLQVTPVNASTASATVQCNRSLFKKK